MKNLGLLCFLNKKQRGGRINHLLIHKYVYFLSGKVLETRDMVVKQNTLTLTLAYSYI